MIVQGCNVQVGFDDIKVMFSTEEQVPWRMSGQGLFERSEKLVRRDGRQ